MNYKNLFLLELSYFSRLYKSAEPSRPPTPDGSDPEKLKEWKSELIKLQSSEEIEISPSEVKEMISEFKKGDLYKCYNSQGVVHIRLSIMV